MQLLAKCGAAKRENHCCANLHRVAKKTGKQLDVRVTTVPLWIRYSKKRVTQVLVNYPVLRFSDWIKCIFSYGGHFFLGGRSLDEVGIHRKTLTEFWENYALIDPSHPFYQSAPRSSWGECIPIALHGHEGRGRGKEPVMVVAVQTIVGDKGKTNMAGFLD